MKKILFVFGITLTLIVGVTTQGRVVTVVKSKVELYKETTKLSEWDTALECEEEANALANADPITTGVVSYRCNTLFTATYVMPPPPEPPIWGVVDSTILGTCAPAIHDKYVLNGGDGYRYRTWHAQVDPSGCIFAHEHGDNPTKMQYGEIAVKPILFGYIGRRMPTVDEPNGHEEAHEGFKVFVANVGDKNDEGRVNRVYSRSVFHMGTGGPKRFTTSMHSADIALYHPEFNLKAYTRLMMNTGGIGAVCDPRKPAPVKDVISLQNPCKINSLYEIWSTTQKVIYKGKTVYQSFATPAVFDPITAFDSTQPTRVLYMWDPAMNAVMNFPNNNRSYVRGCDRENYAQPGYWYNAGTGRTSYWTDSMGKEMASTDSLAIEQYISTSNSVGAPATNDGLLQFKMRQSWCQNRSSLGLKN